MTPPATDERTGRRGLTSEEFRDVIGHFASGVTVITTAYEGQRLGTTASAVCSLSLDPPMVLICMNKSSATGAAVAGAKAFAVNILGEHQGALAEHFASKDPDKFKHVASTLGVAGQPLLADAVAHLECRVTEEVTGGTHTAFLAEVESGSAQGGAPLAYFRGQFGRLEMSLDQTAYETLRQRVLDGKIPPGEPLDLRQLADELQLPPGPLYHALGKLTGEGIVERHAAGTYSVRPMTWAVVEDALDARCTIELGVVDATVGRISDAALERLRRATEAWEPVAEDGRTLDLDTSVTLSQNFHETMVGLARSDALLQAYNRLALPGLMAATFHDYVLGPEDDAFEDEHRELLRAYQDGDATRAREVVLRHHDHIKDAARAMLTPGEPARRPDA